MRLSAFAAALVLAAVLSLTGSPSAHAQVKNNQKQEVKKVKINPGDTLSKIASAHQTTYVRLFDANENIKHPDLIYPGEELRIPAPDEQLTSRPVPVTEVAVVPTPVASAPRAAAPRASVAPVAPNYATGSSVWDRLAQCEAGGNWSINTGNGFYGGLQFTLSSWKAAGGSGYPNQASREEQIARGERLLAMQGWGAWPACSAKLGLR
jgi:resuscitation-promoting factor RpfB